MEEPLDKVTSKYWEIGFPSQASGGAGMETRDLTSSGKIEEWVPDLFAAIGGGSKWNPSVGRPGVLSRSKLQSMEGEQHSHDRTSSDKNLDQFTLVFGLQIKEHYNGHSNHGGDRPYHVYLLSTLFCSRLATHTCYPSAMLGCPSILILIAELRSNIAPGSTDYL